MFFEGAEKRVEIIIKDLNYSLINNLSDDFWYELISCSGAKVLSKIQNEQCKAFVLSESSLFVWHNRFVILTCGLTHLVNSVEFFIQKMGDNCIDYLTYKRKNEYYSQVQPSCFDDDIKTLRLYIKGTSLHFGVLDSHYTALFYKKESNFRMDLNKIYEFSAYQISKSASEQLTCDNLTHNEIQKIFQVDKFLKGFEIDDHVFKPYGYSINAIKLDKYITIHVTPQLESSYVSVESNINLNYLIPTMLKVLSPESFVLLSFNDNTFKYDDIQTISTQYINKSKDEQILENDTKVIFSTYVLSDI